MGDIDPNNDPTRVVDDTPFPDPSLYFKVFDSERDEPDTKYREDVIKLYERWEKKYGRKWPENGLNTEDLVWLYNEAYQDERVKAANAAAAADMPKTYPKEKQDYEGQVSSRVSMRLLFCTLNNQGGWYSWPAVSREQSCQGGQLIVAALRERGGGGGHGV
jgi:hypothetical protein